MKKEVAPVDSRLAEGRKTLRDSREELYPLWVIFAPLRNKTLPREQRIVLRDLLKDLGPRWKHGIDGHIRASKDLISPAKKELGLALTQIKQERDARKSIIEGVKAYGGKDGRILAARSISLTKTLQTREGITDPPAKVRSPRSETEKKVLYIANKPVPNSSL